MLRTAVCLTVAATGIFGAQAFAAEPGDSDTIGEKGTLHWSNGDTLPGYLMHAKSDQLQWKSKLFAEPVTLNANYLKSIIFDRIEKKVSPKDAFQVVFRNGDVVYADIERMDSMSVTMRSGRHGELDVPRAGIRVARRIGNQSMMYAGPNGLEDWKTLTQGAAFERWKTTPDGDLTTTGWLAELFMPLKIPGQVEIELTLKSSDKPRFLIGFGDQPDESVHLETWDDEVVAVAGDDFEPILTLGADNRTVDLRLYWNHTTGTLDVYAPTGKKLGAISGAKATQKRPGIYIQNKGSQLSVTKLRVSRWNGAPPQVIREGETRLHLSDGSIAYGQIESLNAQSGDLKLKTDDGERELKLARIDRIYLADDESDAAGDELVQAMYFDGTRLTGEMTEVADGSIGLRTPWSTEPVVSSLDGARQLRFRAQDKLPQEGVDRLYCEGGVLRGTLAGGDSPENAIQWRPVGGINSTPLAVDGQARFVRGQRTESVKYDANRFSDMLFLTTHDVLPCHVLSIDETDVHFESAMSEKTRIAHKFVKAIELSALSGLHRAGFADPGWKRVVGNEDNLQVKGGAVAFRRPAAFGHPEILRGDEVRFAVEWDGRAASHVSIGLFTDDLRKAAQSPNLQFGLNSNQVTLITSNGRAVRHLVPPQSDENKALTARIRLKAIERTLKVYLNDTLIQSGPLKSTVDTGFVVLVAPGTLKSTEARQSEVVLSDFEVIQSKTEGRRGIDETVLKQALTVPRFRRKNPSTHVLLAPNGDLLRGRLTGMRNDSLRFVSRLEERTFDRRRVAAIVWLHPDGESEAPGWDESRPIVRLVLGGGLIVVLNPEKMTDKNLIGQSPLLGNCSIPVNVIRELHAGGFGPINEQRTYSRWRPHAAPEPNIVSLDGNGSSSFRSPLLEKPAPNFSSSYLDGRKFQLTDLRGQVVVLDFWATWCPPCIKAMPEIEKAVAAFPKDVQLIAVNQEEQSNHIRQFLKTRELGVTVALDGDGGIARRYGIDTFPQTVIIDRGGTVVWHSVGYRKDMRGEIEGVLRGLAKTKDAKSDDATRDPVAPPR